MRPVGGLLSTIAAMVGVPLAAGAAPAPSISAPTVAVSGSALFDAAFAAPRIAVRSDDAAAMEAGGVFAPLADDPVDASNGQGLQVRSHREISAGPRSDGVVDTVRLSITGVARAPGGVVLARPGGLLEPDAQTFDVSYTRGWPAVLRLSGGGYDFDLSPHAGVGFSSAGPSAEAGAMVRLGAHLQDRVISSLAGLGVRTVDSPASGAPGRWYLFAAASGRSVGLTMTRDAQGDLRRASWSADASSTLISDAQAGVGWRKGDMQASFGYVHREVQPLVATLSANGAQKVSDSMVAFSLSFHAR